MDRHTRLRKFVYNQQPYYPRQGSNLGPTALEASTAYMGTNQRYHLPPHFQQTLRRGGAHRVLMAPRGKADSDFELTIIWDDIGTWHSVDGAVPTKAEPVIDDLLARAAFYKVGHHGSHNATLKRKGLERMPNDASLISFVPVSTPVAREIKDWSEMPLDSLLDALSIRSGGRVVFPNGNVWPNVMDDRLVQERERIGLSISDEMLPPKELKGTSGLPFLEDEVPLWVEVDIAF